MIELDLEKLRGKVIYIPKGRNPGKKEDIRKEIVDRLNENGGRPLQRSDLMEIAKKYEVTYEWVRRIHAEITAPPDRKPTEAQVRAIRNLVEELGSNPAKAEKLVKNITRKQAKTLQFLLHQMKTLRKLAQRGYIRKFLKETGVKGI